MGFRWRNIIIITIITIITTGGQGDVITTIITTTITTTIGASPPVTSPSLGHFDGPVAFPRLAARSMRR